MYASDVNVAELVVEIAGFDAEQGEERHPLYHLRAATLEIMYCCRQRRIDARFAA